MARFRRVRVCGWDWLIKKEEVRGHRKQRELAACCGPGRARLLWVHRHFVVRTVCSPAEVEAGLYRGGRVDWGGGATGNPFLRPQGGRAWGGADPRGRRPGGGRGFSAEENTARSP